MAPFLGAYQMKLTSLVLFYWDEWNTINFIVLQSSAILLHTSFRYEGKQSKRFSVLNDYN